VVGAICCSAYSRDSHVRTVFRRRSAKLFVTVTNLVPSGVGDVRLLKAPPSRIMTSTFFATGALRRQHGAKLHASLAAGNFRGSFFTRRLPCRSLLLLLRGTEVKFGRPLTCSTSTGSSLIQMTKPFAKLSSRMLRPIVHSKERRGRWQSGSEADDNLSRGSRFWVLLI